MAPPELVCDIQPECSLQLQHHAEVETDLRRPEVNIEFSNLTYTVHRGTKTILHGVSGQFRAGELSVIMGSSGAGKSSLMDILIGYRSTGVTGSICTNGRVREHSSFHKLSTYIQQNELTQPHLSVLEAMNVAASLRLPMSTTVEQRSARVKEILSTLGLTPCRHTTSDRLSGGQRKRLSIALELVSNPPVLFLDEPTTGLDIVNVTQCINLLRSLAVQQRRTVVCTLHQPSASLLALCHHVYVLAEGKCVYQGSTDQLVPFLAAVQLPCPTYTNPADHVIELTTSGPRQARQENTALLSTSIKNGKLSLKNETELAIKSEDNEILSDEIPEACDEFATPATHQFVVLLRRTLLQASRNKGALRLQVIHHLMSSLLLGALFLNIGQDASSAYVNIKFCVSLMVFFMYTHVMTSVLVFPAEVKLLKREYFNRWYGLKPYFLAMSVARLPSLILLSLIPVVICYFMTNQPLEICRFVAFLAVCILIAFVSESMGLFIGTLFNIKNGCVVGSMAATPLLMIAVYGVGYGELIEGPMKVLMSLSYMRYGAVGLAMTMYGLDREALKCSELYCHYRYPAQLLREMGMQGEFLKSQIFGLIVFFILFRMMTFFALRYRLTPEFDNRILKLSAKLLKHT